MSWEEEGLVEMDFISNPIVYIYTCLFKTVKYTTCIYFNYCSQIFICGINSTLKYAKILKKRKISFDNNITINETEKNDDQINNIYRRKNGESKFKYIGLKFKNKIIRNHSISEDIDCGDDWGIYIDIFE